MLSTDYGFGGEEWTSVSNTRCNPTSQSQYKVGSSHDLQSRVPPISGNSHMYQTGRLNNNDCGVSSRLTSSSSSSGNKMGTGPGRAASVSAVNQAGLSNAAHGNSVQRGKSVRFGENRISVFLQDSTQALEECVKLALSYAEESKRGDYCSDSEAVTLSRTYNSAQEAVTPLYDTKSHVFWSDSDSHLVKAKGNEKREDLKSNNFSSRGSSYQGPPTPTNYKPRSYGQAVNSLDRVERLDKFQLDKSRKKRSAQINEIFSFIDKILSGCDNGCNDERCPFVLESRASRVTSYEDNSFNAGDQRHENSHTYAYSNKLTTGDLLPASNYKQRGMTGTPSPSQTGAGFVSDSDCDISECSKTGKRTGRRPPRSRLRFETSGVGYRTPEDVFAQIIICCETNKDTLGMPKYRHIHQKISQIVCNAIFLCKVMFKL